MDGLNLKFASNAVQKYFTMDQYGSLIPNRNYLRMDEVQDRVERQLTADTGLYRRLTEMYWRTDVEFTDNPYGNTPILGAGVKLFGTRPLNKLSFKGRIQDYINRAKKPNDRLAVRRRKIIKNQEEIVALHSSLEPADRDSKEHLIWQIEQDQSMTGGGFDGNSIGEVTASALHFVNEANRSLEYANSPISRLVVQGSLWLRDKLKKEGLLFGSVSPVGISVTRFEQDKDGTMGYPVYAKANDPLTKDISLRLLIESGVDTREFVDSSVVDKNSGVGYKYRVVDALGHILDRLVLDIADLPSIVTLLARIQKHGWTYDGGKLVEKPSKTRSVYPNAALPAAIEAMIMTPLLNKMQELKISWLPSLQDKPTRVDMIKRQVTDAWLEGFDLLAADWSKYDATVKGHIFATIMYHGIRPFINAKFYDWFDAAIYILTYKYIITDTALCNISKEQYESAKSSGSFVEVEPFTIFGLIDGLISGAKFTHGGGSAYGEVVIHYVIPTLLSYEPGIGPQAGDDTLMRIPRSMIDITSASKTYTPIKNAAAQVGLEMNESKQIWHQVQGEIIKVFLQENYHYTSDVWGTGSIFRPYSAVFFAERNKGLSIAEQMMAEVARMNQGADNPFVDQVVKDWLNKEQFLGALFNEHGEAAFQLIINAVGKSIEEIIQRIDVGSFTFGIDRSDLRDGSLPILPVMARVAAKEQYELTASEALDSINQGKTEGTDTNDLTSFDEVVLNA